MKYQETETLELKKSTSEVAAWAAERLPEADRPQFISLVEAELRGLHEGNIARFRLRPKEFAAWQGKKGILNCL